MAALQIFNRHEKQVVIKLKMIETSYQIYTVSKNRLSIKDNWKEKKKIYKYIKK